MNFTKPEPILSHSGNVAKQRLILTHKVNKFNSINFIIPFTELSNDVFEIEIHSQWQ